MCLNTCLNKMYELNDSNKHLTPPRKCLLLLFTDSTPTAYEVNFNRTWTKILNSSKAPFTVKCLINITLCKQCGLCTQ